jgi:hypothetical protein
VLISWETQGATLVERGVKSIKYSGYAKLKGRDGGLEGG